jgi:predicted nucleic acid-binding protein
VECAVTAHSDYIVTGDKDLLRLKVCEDIPIVRVPDVLEILARGPKLER